MKLKKKMAKQSLPVHEVTTKRSKDDAASAVKLSRRFLTVLGIWQLDEKGHFSWRLVLSYFLLILCYFGLGIRTIPTIIYIFLDAKEVVQICILISRALFCLMACLKYIFLKLHRRDIENCVKHIEMDWLGVESSANRDIMLEHSRYGLLVTRIIAVFTYSGATWQAILPYVLKKTAAAVANDNVTQVVTIRTFPVPSHFGFNLATKTPLFEIISTSQIVATFMMHSIAIASYSIAVVSVMHACGQLKILMEKINHLIDGNGETAEDNVHGRLSNIVRHHVKTLRFISSAEKMLREICLIDLGGCTLELCFLGYFNILEWRAEHKNFVGIMVYLTLFVTFTFNIFSFCYIGELLTEECSKVGEMTYMIDWYRLPGKQPLALCLIITMAHSPMTLTAGGAIQLSFRCFASVIKTSMGYLNMLRTVMD
nr:olfactory receptor 4 [Gregopimpla kuwanae]